MSDAPYHHLIKKYSNRKLYDTYTRRYIIKKRNTVYHREAADSDKLVRRLLLRWNVLANMIVS